MMREGAVIAYPTDSSYALGCELGHKEAQDRIRQIRGVDASHHFTLMCRNLSELASYAQVDNQCYRLLKANTPGQYTFILQATREVPRRLQHPKRNTIGLRVPSHTVTLALLEELGAPMLSMTLSIRDTPETPSEAWQIREQLEHQVDLVIDAGNCPAIPTTVIDLTGTAPVLMRAGAGDPEPFGL